MSDDRRYTFSLFAFPEAKFPAAFSEFIAFVRDYHDRVGYRANLAYVGYRIAQDQNALLSYSYDGNVMTIDPVSPQAIRAGSPSSRPIINSAAIAAACPAQQTFGLTPEIAHKAYGDRLKTFAEARRKFDPGDRLLKDYFRMLLA